MSKKAHNLSELEARKATLESEINLLKDELSGTVEDIKDDIEEKANPKYWIGKYPLQVLAVCVSAGIGFGWGIGGRKSKKAAPDSTSASTASFFGDEIKKMIMKKGAELVMSAIQEKLEKNRTQVS